MGKFYVTSGDMKCILNSGSPQQAVVCALGCIEADGLSEFVKVSEQGFDSINDEDVMFLTEVMLRKAGIEGDFTHISEPPGDEPNLAQG